MADITLSCGHSNYDMCNCGEPPARKHQTLEDVISDMENCSEQCHNGLSLEPQTLGHVFDAFTYELSFYAEQALSEKVDAEIRKRLERFADPIVRENVSFIMLRSVKPE